MQSPLITTKQFFARLSISQATFFRLRSTGKIGPRCIKIGRLLRWDEAEVESWIKAKCPPYRVWQTRILPKGK